MEDEIDRLFGELDNFYPGSKRKRREESQTPRRNVVEESSWESRSIVKRIHGVDRPMYTIGALAQALNKSEKSIRLWTTRGYIPQAPYRMRSVEGSDGVTRAGRRLYTKEMIDAAVASFARRDLLDSPRIEWKQHAELTQEILIAWREIQQSIANPSQ